MVTSELIIGDSKPPTRMFSITAPADASVGGLKDLVYAKAQNLFRALMQMTSFSGRWLHEPIPADAADERVAALGQDPSAVAVEMLHNLSDYFPASPPPECLHVIVQRPVASTMLRNNRKRAREEESAVTLQGQDTGAPGAKKPRPNRPYSHPLAGLGSHTARRASTVIALYERLNYYRFVLVRGPPGSGKSTLAELLKEHIRAHEPGVELISIGSCWSRDEPNWVSRLTPQYDQSSSAKNIIIIDAAQFTYWDYAFWNSFVKSITTSSRDRLILFTTYGSPKSDISEDVPSNIWIPDCIRVNLRPVDRGDGITPAGLFLLPDEFDDMVNKACSAACFKADFLDYVFRATAGHTGAVKDLLRVVEQDEIYRGIKQGGEEYSLEIFRSQFPMEKLWSRLYSSSACFLRGLPMPDDLYLPEVARVLGAALRNNYVTRQPLDPREDQAALDRCFRWWLHATTNEEGKTVYIFTTQLHRAFVEYYLAKIVTDPTLIPDQDLPSFAIKVIQLFSSLHLSSPRKIGASDIPRPSEARFQDEFYCCCHAYSIGSLVSFPGFADTDRKIDLYIPLKQWGVELLRDGEGLENHSSRFTGPNAYAEMEFKDSIILDFRTSLPQESHPEIPNLYHVVIVNDYKHVSIHRGSSLEEVANFELLN